jgi:hypothetical protein
MTAIRVSVTAEYIAEAEGKPHTEWWAWPIRAALEELTHVDVDIDGGDGEGCIATIGGREDVTLVVELPEYASAWLDTRWESDQVVGAGGVESEPIVFEIELPAWLVALAKGSA